MDSFFSLVFSFLTKHVPSILSLSLLQIKTSIELGIRDFLRFSILSSIVTEFFCLSTLIAFFEMAYQYDNTQNVRLSAVLVISISISILSLGFLGYFFQSKKININTNIENIEASPCDKSLEQAISLLIIEFAKDKEFARDQLRKEQSQNSETLRRNDK